METWRCIECSPNYEVSNYGNVRNSRTNRILKPFKNNGRNYLLVDLPIGKKQVHRLVASAFIPNPNNLPEIDHIDNDGSNNNVDNLRWISRKDNCNRRPRVLGASITFTKSGYWNVQYQFNKKNCCKYFKEEDYLLAELFFLEKCADFE